MMLLWILCSRGYLTHVERWLSRQTISEACLQNIRRLEAEGKL